MGSIPYASRIMPRTTLNIDDAVLRQLKARSQAEHKPLGQLASELLAGVLHAPDSGPAAPFRLPTASMGAALVDLDDKEAVRRALADELHP